MNERKRSEAIDKWNAAHMTASNAKPSGKTAQGQERQHDPVFEHLLPEYRAIRERNALLEMGTEHAKAKYDALAAQNIELVEALRDLADKVHQNRMSWDQDDAYIQLEDSFRRAERLLAKLKP